eukprot:5006850-Karenia_brevis.AAC.1
MQYATPGAPSASQAQTQENQQEVHSSVTFTPEPTPTVVASPYIVPSNTEPEHEDDVKGEMRDEVKDESGGDLEPSAPPKSMILNPESSTVPASVATLPSGVMLDPS